MACLCPTRPTGSYKQLEYCTQYSESDFHFVSRILEESGIFYYFEHTDQDHKIVLGDGRTAYQDCPLSASIPYALSKRGAEGAYGAAVSEFTATSNMVSGKHTTAEYNYRNFARVDVSEKNSSSPFGKNAFDQYLYPSGGEGYANDATQPSTDLETLFLETRALASDSTAEIFRGAGNARSFCAGYTFSLTTSPRNAWNRKYLLTAVTLRADQLPPYRTSDVAAHSGYTNQFTAISSELSSSRRLHSPSHVYTDRRRPLLWARPARRFTLTILVARQVQFFWDKLKAVNTVDTTWVRVAQSWPAMDGGLFLADA